MSTTNKATGAVATRDINLENLDVTVLVDRSGSMDEPQGGGITTSRWDYAAETIKAFVTQIGKLDDDGIDLCFFNRGYNVSEGVTPASFVNVWDSHRPSGGTVMGPPLSWALKKSVDRRGEKNQLVIVLTDGQPEDEAAIIGAIVSASQQIDRDEQLAILFVQVGRDQKATAFLERLDTQLGPRGAKFDIVHSTTIDEIANKPMQEVVNLAFFD